MKYPKMKFVVLLILCIAVVGFAKNKKKTKTCRGVHVNGRYHKKIILANGLNRPYQLSLENYRERLYFSYNVGVDEEDKFEIGYLDKGKKVPTPIPSVENGFASTIDDESEVIYFGGSDGIYEQSLHDLKDIAHVIKGRDIWDVYFKNHLYFIDYPSQRLYKIVGNTSELVERIPEKVYNFVIDGDNDTFITTETGLLQIRNGTIDRIPYAGPKIYRAIVVDQKGIAHFCGQSSIYVANKGNNTLKEVAHVKNIFGLVFDEENNIIYSDPHEIVKLVPGECK